jgi:hypothetical protein
VVKRRDAPYVPTGMAVSRPIHRFAAGLEDLLAAPDAPAFERVWERAHLATLGWDALAGMRRTGSENLEPVLARVDRLLLALLERSRALLDPHIATFRIPELERWQHAAAAALVGVRWGVAGLRTVIGDLAAPLARRYFAFLALAERHPAGAWPLFEKYLVTPGAHHAFVAAAVQAARFYPGSSPVLLALFDRIRADQMWRRFLGPKILESLYVLGESTSLALFEELLVAGHTDADVECCEVTRALVAVRKLTGRVAPSSKYADPDAPDVRHNLDDAERRFDAERFLLSPVIVI